MEALQVALFLALVNERVIEYLIAPLFEKFWTEGSWLLMYVVLVTGGLLSFLAGVDLLAVAGVASAVLLMVAGRGRQREIRGGRRVRTDALAGKQPLSDAGPKPPGRKS